MQESPGSPKKTKDQDQLQRWPFAEGIYDFIKRSPANWPLRIGIYGGWGKGKTTVLNFIEFQAKQDSYQTAWFNPWQYRTLDDMWAGLLETIHESLKLGLSRQKVAKGIRWLANRAKPLTDLDPTMKAKTALALLDEGISFFTRAGRAHLEQALSAFKDKRLIILVDDMDRANPQHLSEIFYILREALDLPNIAFIFGLDPDIVLGGLAAYNPAWKGEKFLEKIIDFPHWLPEPTDDEIRGLILKELDAADIVADREALFNLMPIIPRNPRTVIQFIRGMSELEPVLRRHESDELNWATIYISQLLKNEYPGITRDILGSDKIADWLSFGWFYKHKNEADENKTPQEFFEIVKSKDLSARSLARLEEIIHVWRGAVSAISKEALFYNANLLHTPPVITWKEFTLFFQSWVGTLTINEVEDFISQHSAKIGVNRTQVLRDLFLFTIDFRLSCFDRAADVNLEDDLLPELVQAEAALTLIRFLAIDFRGLVGGDPLFSMQEFEALFGMAAKWSHFRNHEQYIKARANERDLLLSCCKLMRALSPSVLGFLVEREENGSWRERDKAWEGLVRDLIGVLEPFVAEKVLHLLSLEGGMTFLRRDEEKRGERFVLFNAASALYREPLRDRFLEKARQGHTNKTIQNNFFEFVEFLGLGLKDRSVPISADKIKSFISDRTVIMAIWNAASYGRVQPRMIHSLKESQEAINAAIGEKDVLKMPSWHIASEPK